MLENGPWFIRNNPLILKKWHPDENLVKEDGRSSYARVMIELRADVELKDNIVVAMPKITKEGHYTCNVCVEYEWKPPRCSSCKVFGHIYEECPKNTGVGEKKIVKKPSQTSRCVPVGPKMGFKPQKEYRLVPKKPNASSSDNKKESVEPTIEVSNSNPFDVLNSVDNDVKDSYPDNDDYDSYDDDMYENHDMSEHLQSIYDDLDITVRGRKNLEVTLRWCLVDDDVIQANTTLDNLISPAHNLFIPLFHTDKFQSIRATNFRDVRSAHLFDVIAIIIRGEAPNDGGPGAAPLVAGSKGQHH
nr:hypothetical protein [Tanacetum cinerariifolium]